MTKPKVYIAQNIPTNVEEYIGKFCDYEMWQGEDQIPRKEMLKKLSDVEGIMLFATKIDEEFLNHAPKLKVVSNLSVGYNNFDIEEMKKRNIIGTNTPGVLDDTVADLIFGLMLTASRKISALDRYVKDQKWKVQESENLFGLDVHHSTVGIIGMGRIGEAVAKRAKFGFDMDVLYYNRNRKYEAEEKLGVKYCDFKSLLENSDFIVVMTPLTKETEKLIGAEEFALMKKTAIFINASRGQTVDEQALIEALESKKIFGAGLDVYENEPVKPDNPLLKMDNVVTLPHIGSATNKTRSDMAELAALNMVKALYGETPPNIVPEFNE